jgi:hypothetical protein
MSTTKSSGTGIAFRTPQPKLFRQAATRPVSAAANARIYPFPSYMDKAGAGVLGQFDEQFRLDGIDDGSEESFEFRVLEQFLDRHVQTNMICDVQCMLLWSEWVRTYKRHTLKFPELILEKEFRDAITDKFGVGIATYSVRGEVYPGIKFVP